MSREPDAPNAENAENAENPGNADQAPNAGNDRGSSSSSSSAPLLEVRGVSKRFPGVQALRNVDLHVGRGEVVAVIGENGAGKSTLMKILAGVQSPDSGEILLDGVATRLDSVRTAIGQGISLIHQELNLADNLDVASNIFLGRESQRWGLLRRQRQDADAQRWLARVGLEVTPRTLTETLAIGQQQLIEIAKALSAGSRLLIMDEPTSSLSKRESDRLFEVIRELQASQVSIIYISHRLGEVKRLADRVVVLRDGENAGHLDRAEIDHDRMVRLMVGRDISQFYVRASHAPGEVALEARGLRTAAHPRHGVSFQIRTGEIVGLAGLVGAGRSELLQVLFGVHQPLAGEILVGGQVCALRSPLAAIQHGIALVPEDRKQQGVILEMAVRENISLARLRRDQRRGWLNRAAERQLTGDMIRQLNIKTPSPEQVVQFLSGGNQQKVVLAKWLAMRPRVLLLDEPTRGIDVGAKQEVYGMMDQLASAGMAVLFVSSELEEILGMSDRALVMHEGRLTGELPRKDLSEESVMRLATGGTPQPAPTKTTGGQ